MDEYVTVSADIPKEWADIIKESAKNSKPRISRKALVYKVIERYVNGKIKRKGK